MSTYEELREEFDRVAARNEAEYEALAEMEGKTIAEVEADLTAPDPRAHVDPRLRARGEYAEWGVPDALVDEVGLNAARVVEFLRQRDSNKAAYIARALNMGADTVKHALMELIIQNWVWREKDWPFGDWFNTTALYDAEVWPKFEEGA
jgi:hypothetical protein